MKKNKNRLAKLLPIGKDGKEVDWFYGWPGVQKLAKAFGVSWLQVGELLEDTYGTDRTTMKHIHFASAVYASLQNVKEGYYKSKRLTKEEDLHFAIRMDLPRIKRLYYDATTRKKSTAKDFFKAARQLYKNIMEKRSATVLSLFNNIK